jgi:hypothetical protein
VGCKKDLGRRERKKRGHRGDVAKGKRAEGGLESS